jgi:ribosomal protein S12 methylthiotransferase accessory factor
MYLRGEGWSADAVLPKPKSTDSMIRLSARFVAQELASTTAPARLLTLDLRQDKRQERVVVRRPQCPRCGDPGWMTKQMERPVVLTSRSKAETADGGHRIESPESTYRRLAHLVDPLVGCVASLGELPTKNHESFPVFGASHFIRPAAGPVSSDERFHQLSIGKGKSVAQAQTSALCEALERKSARYQGDEPRLRGSYRDLSPAAVDPRDLLLFSERQYALGTPEDIKARWRELGTARSQAVPRPFDPTQPIDWTPAWSLTHDTRRYVPLAYVFAGAPQPEVERVCAWDSNGCAAGNCIEEAILQGLFELVERDATAIWWYNRIPRPRVDLGSFGQPYFAQVHDWYARAGHELWVLDLTHDLGIPVVIALAAEVNGDRYAAGLGCHLDMGLAVQRALTELNQVFDPKHLHAPLFTRGEVGDESFLRPAAGSSHSTGGSYPNRATDDLKDDIRLCCDRLKSVGLDVLVADYSRPDIDLATAKVMVPGLRHFWPRLAPGRLFDVPSKLGWLPKPLEELTLNPLPLLM